MNKKSQGFTLLEIMIALVIIAILATIALPSFNNTIVKNKMDTKASDLLRDFNLARSEAIKRGVSVTICPSDDGTQCSGGTDYSKGWIIFTDLNEDGSIDAGEDQIRVVTDVDDKIDISGQLSYVCYNSSGLLC